MRAALCPVCQEEPLPGPFVGKNGFSFEAKRGAGCALMFVARARGAQHRKLVEAVAEPVESVEVAA